MNRYVQPADQILTLAKLKVVFDSAPPPTKAGVVIWREQVWRDGGYIGDVKAIEWTDLRSARVTYRPRKIPAPAGQPHPPMADDDALVIRGGRDEFGARG